MLESINFNRKIESIRLLYQGMLRDSMSSQKAESLRNHIIRFIYTFCFLPPPQQHVVIGFTGLGIKNIRKEKEHDGTEFIWKASRGKFELKVDLMVVELGVESQLSH